jgi:Protein of unknown function, DUF481
MKIRVLIFSLTLFFCSPLFAREKTDVIVMKNGDRFTCEIKGLSAGVLSVKLSYAQGTVSLEWAQVARLESDQLFIVQTEDGTVYTGELSTAAKSGERPMSIEIASAPEKEVEIPQSQVIKLNQTAESFRRRFNGAISTGILYSKGNETTQYNIASQVEYPRERWSSQASVNSSLASSSGANSIATRNQVDLSGMRLLRWNNWFYSGTGNFLQSSVQGIDLQTTVGGGIGRYLRNSNQASLYVLGGLAWQNAQYKTYTAGQGAQNAAAALVDAELKVFRFKKTDLDISAVVLPGISEPGRIRANTNASYYIKLFSDLSWNFSFYGNWDNQPPPTLSGSDYGTSSGLSWTFGNR